MAEISYIALQQHLKKTDISGTVQELETFLFLNNNFKYEIHKVQAT
jgi:hypothetical protein